MQIETVDLKFRGMPRIIAAYLVSGPAGLVLVETGPASTLPTLLGHLGARGLDPKDIRHVLVTHIHLDHAGAAGWWAQQGATVFVHPFGAPHLVDPSKLLASAERIYGDQIGPLWGNILPAPPERVKPVRDGEPIAVAGLVFTALETPGHARHHHAYRLEDVAFTGDAAGIRRPGTSWIDLPAPPPEFDLELWKASIARLREQQISTLYPTHFGPTTAVAEQLDMLETWLERATGFVRSMIDEGLERDAMVERYSAWLVEHAIAAGVAERSVRAYDVVNPRAMSVDGIARYWRRRAES